MGITKYTILDMHTMRSSLYKHLTVLQSEISEVEINIKKIDQILKLNTSSEKKVQQIILLPHEFLKPSQPTIINIRWKKIVFSTLQKSDIFLSCNMIFDKIKTLHPIQLNHDPRYANKSISSALTNLVSEGKVGKIKGENGMYYFGDFNKHFKNDGKPNMDLYKK